MNIDYQKQLSELKEEIMGYDQRMLDLLNRMSPEDQKIYAPKVKKLIERSKKLITEN